jgi:hypothetical protein
MRCAFPDLFNLATDPAHHFITHTATDDTLSLITQHTKLDTNSLSSPLHSIHTRDNISATTCRANVKKLIIYYYKRPLEHLKVQGKLHPRTGHDGTEGE